MKKSKFEEKRKFGLRVPYAAFIKQYFLMQRGKFHGKIKRAKEKHVPHQKRRKKSDIQTA